MNTAEVLPELCPLRRACSVTGQSKTYIYGHLGDKDDPFPKPIRINGRVFWLLPDLIAWNVRKARASGREDGWMDGYAPQENEKPL